MRVALISDIHANLVALETALTDIEQRGADRIVCLGDIADLGPQPKATLARLRELGCPCILGNHDPFTESFPGLEPVIEWCKARLDNDDLTFLATRPATLTIELAPGIDLLCAHGSPDSYDFQLLSDTADSALEGWPLAPSVTAVVCGHTHVQLLRRYKGRTFVNVGSVGAPFLAPFDGVAPPHCLKRVEYALVEYTNNSLVVQLCSLPLDFCAYEAAVRDAGFPEPDAWLEQWNTPMTGCAHGGLEE